MHIELARRLGDVEVVLEEAVDRVERVVVERFDRVFLERLGEEHFAQRDRQLIDDAADAEVLIVDDGLLVFEDLAHVDGDLRLFVAVGQLAQMAGRRADADDGFDVLRLADVAHEIFRQSAHLLGGILARELLDDDDVRLAHGEHKVVLTIREAVLHMLQNGDVVPVELAHQQNGAGHVRGEVQLLGADIHVAGENVVADDILYKGGLVVLFLEVRAGLVHADGGENADAARNRVRAGDEDGVLKARRAAGENFIGALRGGEQRLLRLRHGGEILQPRADGGKLAARNHKALLVHDADDAVRGFFHLNDYALENSTGHS